MPRSFSTAVSADLVHGALELERTPIGLRPHRLPAWAREQAADAQLSMAESQPSGVRLVFATAATRIELRAHATRFGYRGAPPRPSGVFDLVADGRLAGRAGLTTATTVTIDMATGDRQTEAADVGGVLFEGLSAEEKLVEIWPPHNETVELVELRSDAALTPVTSERLVWLHHGSSISHGLEAPSPDRRWPAQVALRRGWDLHDLSFSGNAQLDPFAARMIRDTPADLVTLKVGINLVNADSMRRRTMLPALHGFLDTVREGHPTTPVVLITAIACPAHEDAPGPVVVDPGTDRARAAHRDVEADAGALTLAATREVVAAVHRQRAAQDPHLHLVDGLSLLGPDDAHLLHDGLHPSPAGLDLVAARFLDADLPLLGDRGL